MQQTLNEIFLRRRALFGRARFTKEEQAQKIAAAEAKRDRKRAKRLSDIGGIGYARG